MIDIVKKRVIVFDSREELAACVVERWCKIALEVIEEKGFMTAALSGGRTPVSAYQALAREKETLPWEKTHIFLVDERYVAYDHKDSNYGMIAEYLLANIPIPEENVHPMRTDLLSHDEAALRYSEDLIKFFGLEPGQFPKFDLIILGLGEDGHTASLFPGSTVIDDWTNPVRAVMPGGNRGDRITMTLPSINHGSHIIFLVEGREKAVVLKRLVEDGDQALPAARIRPDAGDLTFLADFDAASVLSSGSYMKGRIP